jgi:hypothetical protein
VAWDNYDYLSQEKSFSLLNVNSLEIQKKIDEIKSAIDSESVDFKDLQIEGCKEETEIIESIDIEITARKIYLSSSLRPQLLRMCKHKTYMILSFDTLIRKSSTEY